MNLAVFVSGRGSNLNAILNSDELKNLISVKIVVSNKISCGAFEIAKKFGIEIVSVSKTMKDGFIDFNSLLHKLKILQIDLIVLAGFLKMIPIEIISYFENRIINIHPALLPAFGGSGMYGMNVHNAVYNSSAKISGASVHFVNEFYDKGLIIAQRCVDISDVKSPEEISQRVLQIEHSLLPFVIKKFIEKKVHIVENRVLLEN